MHGAGEPESSLLLSLQAAFVETRVVMLTQSSVYAVLFASRRFMKCTCPSVLCGTSFLVLMPVDDFELLGLSYVVPTVTFQINSSNLLV